MPGYTVIDSNGEERLVWENPMQRQINEMATPFFFVSLDIYLNFKACGTLPFGGGYMQERATTIQIIRIFEQESNRYESWYMKHRDELDGGGSE
jgi:hypothetical protein